MEAIAGGGVAVACTKVVTSEGIEEKTVWKMLREVTVGPAPDLTDCTMENITSSALEITNSSYTSVYSAIADETCSFPGPSQPCNMECVLWLPTL